MRDDRVSHVNVVGFLDVVHDPRAAHAALVLEYADRGDLKRAVREAAEAFARTATNATATATAAKNEFGETKNAATVGYAFPALSLERTRDIARDLLNALAFVHARGIAHRDVKPENVLLCDDGAGGVVAKLADFGARRRSRDAARDIKRQQTKAAREDEDEDEDEDAFRFETEFVTDLVGTPAYMSPETGGWRGARRCS